MIVIVAIASAGLFSFRSRIISNTQVFPTPSPTTGLPAPSPTTHNLQPTTKPSPIPLNTPVPVTTTNNPQPTTDNLVYPGSRQVADGVYESPDDTDTITDWYKAKINSLGYNVKTFVKTSANDKILNKLVGAKPREELSVEISKNPGSPVALITIRLDK